MKLLSVIFKRKSLLLIHSSKWEMIFHLLQDRIFARITIYLSRFISPLQFIYSVKWVFTSMDPWIFILCNTITFFPLLKSFTFGNGSSFIWLMCSFEIRPSLLGSFFHFFTLLKDAPDLSCIHTDLHWELPIFLRAQIFCNRDWTILEEWNQFLKARYNHY